MCVCEGKHFLRALFPGFEDLPPTFMVCVLCLSLCLSVFLSQYVTICLCVYLYVCLY